MDKLEFLEILFGSVYIPNAVWEELTKDKSTICYKNIVRFFQNRIKKIDSFNDLTFIMDYGESEAVILYKEMNANYLLIDDKKARVIAENFDINCVGTLGILILAKERKLILELRPLFLKLIKNKRYYSIKLLNALLTKYSEKII